MRKQQLLLPSLLLVPAFYFIACQDTEQAPVLPAQQATVTAALVNANAAQHATGYELQVKESQLTWSASHVVGGGHEGTLQLESGNLAADASGKWVGGYFVIDMNSINVTDVKEKGEKSSLEKHLKDDDFFSVPKYPKAYFTLTSAVPGTGINAYTITGKLNIKGINNDISFPATLAVIGDSVKAQASFRINRTKWGVNYQSGSIFSSLKDGIINDYLPITLNLVFKKMP